MIPTIKRSARARMRACDLCVPARSTHTHENTPSKYGHSDAGPGGGGDKDAALAMFDDKGMLATWRD